jgi:hypothetical protein
MEWKVIGLLFLLILGINFIFYFIGGLIPGLKNSSNRIIVPFFVFVCLCLLLGSNGYLDWVMELNLPF